MKSGFVSIIGRPNVGKSTLINSIVGEKIAITCDKAGTTRNLIQGIYNDSDTQIVFIDTPGIHKPINKLGNKMNSSTYNTMKEVDVVLLIMDVTSKLGTGDKFVFEKLAYVEVPVILVLNKIDKISNEELLVKELIERFSNIKTIVKNVNKVYIKCSSKGTMSKPRPLRRKRFQERCCRKKMISRIN